MIRLLRDPKIDPDSLSEEGWNLAGRDVDFSAAPAQLAVMLEEDQLVLTLLHESRVDNRAVEKSLTLVRRWLALTSEWRNYPKLVDALVAQTGINGGAWSMDAEEMALPAAADSAMVRMYLPERGEPANASQANFDDAVTRAVAEEYENWPFPDWRRITARAPARLPDLIRRIAPDTVCDVPVDARVLIAGCGSGLEAVSIALEYPDARLTAIDISEASLRYSRAQCEKLGAEPIRFERMDLRNVKDLGEEFDVIFCSGVLHHMADPEAGWECLNAVLRPGGTMRIMLYSRIGRLPVEGARRIVADLREVPITTEVLREARMRILAHPNQEGLALVVNSSNFSTLAGTYDVLLHPHEDLFDIPRIARALERVQLRCLGFELPPSYRDKYLTSFPEDPLFRNPGSLHRFELANPGVFAGCYVLWCQKGGAS